MEERRHKRHRGGKCSGEKSTVEKIYVQLRQVQNMTGCTTRTLNAVLQKLHPFLKGCENVDKLMMPRVRARRKSPVKQQLHGCNRCDYVFGPANNRRNCPQCGNSRYLDGKPQEVTYVVSVLNH
jgi:rubrerythrin